MLKTQFLAACVAVFCVLPASAHAEQQAEPVSETDAPTAALSLTDRFARLALDCVHREYPNKISHVLQSDEDARTPRELTPAFYGCFDWHSSVHGHWLLTRILTTAPDSTLRDEIRAALAQSFTEENLAGELAYYQGEDRAAFERPYGIAWYLQLVAELEESDDAQLSAWRESLRPLEDEIVSNTMDWLPRLSYPIRLGTHNQSAFAFGLMLDYARTVGNTDLEAALTEKSLAFHLEDTNCPIGYEPSGEDFLSPCLMEADLMRRILEPDAFSVWLSAFLPGLPEDGSADWLAPGIVLDARDGKLVHLDGVNLSRAWALEGIAAGLPVDDPRRAGLLAAAEIHREAGIAAVSDEHYSGSHWLASFATYLQTRRGLTGAGQPG
ncbi:DUF2891 domain-containing protein [Henriciella litoralis]|uniref:DUF2891 domain-containing protein n=1 Tax=Henriciella litoralis TaxID=568102 RepID=UPI000A012389|nr:DUF2891 domain-containing protein [Henriciella litoralis]